MDTTYIFYLIIALVVAFIVYRIFRKIKGMIISAIVFTLISGGGIFTTITDTFDPIEMISEMLNLGSAFNGITDTITDTISESIGGTVSTVGDTVGGWFDFGNDNQSKQPTTIQSATNNQTTAKTVETVVSYYTEPLSTNTKSNTTDGAAKYGAIIVLGDLDDQGRSTYAHIRLKDSHEPGNNNESRSETINVDPVGWGNYKINDNWANNRCHLIGYQFSGLNDELRNLSIGTSYLNKGSESSGMDQSNPDGMLFYEQALDSWLAENPNNYLDLLVRPIYEGTNNTPSAYYMQWTGFTSNNQEVAIDISGGHATIVSGNTYGVLLTNSSPSYNIDYTTGYITAK